MEAEPDMGTVAHMAKSDDSKIAFRPRASAFKWCRITLEHKAHTFALLSAKSNKAGDRDQQRQPTSPPALPVS